MLESIVVGEKGLLARGPHFSKTYCWGSLSAEIKAKSFKIYLSGKRQESRGAPESLLNTVVTKISFTPEFSDPRS